MNNSLGPGGQWNGHRGPNYSAYNGQPEQIISSSHSLNPGAINPHVVSSVMNSNVGHGMNLNSNASLGNTSLGFGMSQTNSVPRMVNTAGPLNMQTQQNRHPQINGYPTTSGQASVNMSTSSSVGARFPLWDMDIPSQMFMQAINLDQLMGTHGGIGDMSFGSGPGTAGNIMNSTRLSEESSHKSGEPEESFT